MTPHPSSIRTDAPRPMDAAPLEPPAGGSLRPSAARLSCPYCGTKQSSATNLWRHKAACTKNPNPTCAYCAQHYRASELERHKERCPQRDAPATAATAPPTHAAPAATEDDAGTWDMEDDGVTGVFPPATVPHDDDARAVLAALVAHEPAMHEPTTAAAPERVRLDPALALIAQDAHEWRDLGRRAPSRRGGLEPMAAPLLEELQERVRSVNPQDWKAFRLALHLRDRRLQEAAEARRALAWGAIILLGVLILLAYLHKRSARPASAATAAPATPAYRPPYNPDTHGSVDAYRAGFGHLPAQPATADAGASAVGLDRARRA